MNAELEQSAETERSWGRYEFRGNKVWVLLDGRGEPKLDAGGKARFCYRPDDEQQYTTWPDRLRRIEACVETTDLRTARAWEGRQSSATRRRSVHLAGTQVVDADSPPDQRSQLEDPGLVHIWLAAGDDGRWAAVMGFRQHRRRLTGEWAGASKTSLEVRAATAALGAVKDRSRPIALHARSEVLAGLVARGWKAREDHEDLPRLKRLLRRFPGLLFHLVRGDEEDEGLAEAQRSLEGEGG
jgi:ribonuclease HI